MVCPFKDLICLERLKMVLGECDNREMLLRNLCAASLAIFKELEKASSSEGKTANMDESTLKKSYLALQSIVSEKSAFHEDVLYANVVLDESERDCDEFPLPFMHSSIHCLVFAVRSIELCTDNGHNEVV